MKKTKISLSVIIVFCICLNTFLPMLVTAQSSQQGKLIAYYNFDDAANLGKDFTDNANDLEKVGTGTLSSDTGYKGTAAKFDGASALAAVETAGKDFTDSLTSFTVSLYLKLDGSTDDVARIINSGYNGSHDGMSILVNKWQDNIYYRAIVGDSDGFNSKDHWGDCVTIENCGSTDWHNYIMVYDDTSKTVKAYFDKTLVKSYTLDYSSNMNSALKFAIGGSFASWDTQVSQGFKGLIDDVKIFDYAVDDIDSVDRIPADEEDDSQDIASGLVGHYSFDDGQNLGKDSTANGNNLNKVGTGNVASAAGYKGSAAKFDGAAALVASETAGKDFSDSLTSFTMSFYLKLDSSTTDLARVINTGYSGSHDGMSIFINRWQNNIYYRPIVGDTNGNDVSDHWNEDVTIEKCLSTDWHHYVMTYDAQTKTVNGYFDGSLVKSYTLQYTNNMDSALCFAIGGGFASWDTSVSNGFKGLIDEVKIFDFAIKDISKITDSDSDEEDNQGEIKKYKINELEGKYKTQGRTYLNNDILELNWSASGIVFSAECKGDVSITVVPKAINAETAKDGIYFTAIVDGVPQDFEKRIPNDNSIDNWVSNSSEYPYHINKYEEMTFTIASGLSEGVHTFEIYSQTEPYSGYFGIKDITMQGRINDAPENKDLFIEFIGASLTAGYGNIATGTNGSAALYQDATRGWPYLTAMKLNADWSIVAQSGITATDGIGWGNNPRSMSEMYLKTTYDKDENVLYGFNRKSDVIVIGLGVNDLDTYENFGLTLEDVEEGFEDFAKLVRSKNPDSKIVWLYDLMATSVGPIVKAAIEDLGGEEANYYSFQMGVDNSGADNHPGLSVQSQWADKLSDYLSSILNDEDKDEDDKENEEDEKEPEEEKLIAHYKFDDSDNLGKDYSDNGNNLSKVGSGKIESAEGISGKSAKFDGLSALVAKEIEGKDFTDDLSSFTMSFYLKLDGSTDEVARIINSGYNGSQDGMSILVNKWEDNIYYRAIVGDSKGESSKDHWDKDATIENCGSTDWHNYIMVYDAKTKTVKAYFDETLVKSYKLDYSENMNSPLSFAIGGCFASWDKDVSQGFKGNIDEVKIYNYAVENIKDINKYISSNNEKNKHALIAHYTFEDEENLGKDSTDFNNDLHKVGSGKIISEVGYKGKGARFDGASALVAEEIGGKDFTDGLKSFTISFYLKLDFDNDQVGRIINSGYNGAQDGMSILINRWENNIYYRAIVGDSDGKNGTDHWDKDITIENCGSTKWHHYIMSYDSETKTVKAYFDKKLVKSYKLDYSENMNSALNFAIGGSFASWDKEVSQGFKGLIDEVKIYNYALEDISVIEGFKSPQTGYPDEDFLFDVMVVVCIISGIGSCVCAGSLRRKRKYNN